MELGLVNEAVPPGVDGPEGVEDVGRVCLLHDEVEHEDQYSQLDIADLHPLSAPTATLKRTTCYKQAPTPARFPTCSSSPPRTQPCSKISPIDMRSSKFFSSIRLISCFTSGERVCQMGF